MSRIDAWLADQMQSWAQQDLSALADKASAEGLYDEGFVGRAVMNTIKADLRRRLKKRGPNGVPLAGNLRKRNADGEVVHLYKATQFFDDSDYKVVIQDHIVWAQREIKTAHAYEEDRREKFGGQLQIPQLVYSSEAKAA